MIDALTPKPRPTPQAAFRGMVDRARDAWRAFTGEYSVQPRFTEGGPESMYSVISMFSRAAGKAPDYGTQARDEWLRDYVFDEDAASILRGAIYSMVAKFRALDWQLVGDRDLAVEYRDVLVYAEEDWNVWLAKFLADHVICDKGSFAELGRQGSENGPVRGVYNLDSVRMHPTGQPDKPWKYVTTDGRHYPLKPADFVRLTSMPCPDETKRGWGFSAVSRALRDAKLLDSIIDYEEDRFKNLPPEGVVAVTGLTRGEVETAWNLYKAARESKEQYTYPGLLWFVANRIPIGQQQQEINVKLTPFSTLPEYFDKQVAVELFVKTLALCFGVDVGEFWQTARPTQKIKGEATIQAQKAKGKGFGEIITLLERMFNYHILPRGVKLAFDAQDDEDDYLAAQINDLKIKNVKELYSEQNIAAVPMVTREEARYLLVREGILPEWFIEGYEREVGIKVKDMVVAKRDGRVFPLTMAFDDKYDLERELGVMARRLRGGLARSVGSSRR